MQDRRHESHNGVSREAGMSREQALLSKEHSATGDPANAIESEVGLGGGASALSGQGRESGVLWKNLHP